jgi:hypothetical protein
MIGVSFEAMATTASSSGLLPASRPKPYCAPKFDDLALLVHLDGVDAAVAALVVVLAHRALKRLMNFAEPMLEDVGEAQQDGRRQAAKLEPIDQSLDVDAALRIFGGMHQQVALLAHREVALPPARHVVEFRRFSGRPRGGSRAVTGDQASACDCAHRRLNRINEAAAIFSDLLPKKSAGFDKL